MQQNWPVSEVPTYNSCSVLISHYQCQDVLGSRANEVLILGWAQQPGRHLLNLEADDAEQTTNHENGSVSKSVGDTFY